MEKVFVLKYFLSFSLDAARSHHRNRNTKKGKAGCWQARLTNCVLGNAVNCQLEKSEGDNPKKGDLKLVNALAALEEKFYLR